MGQAGRYYRYEICENHQVPIRYRKKNNVYNINALVYVYLDVDEEIEQQLKV